MFFLLSPSSHTLILYTQGVLTRREQLDRKNEDIKIKQLQKVALLNENKNKQACSSSDVPAVEKKAPNDLQDLLQEIVDAIDNDNCPGESSGSHDIDMNGEQQIVPQEQPIVEMQNAENDTEAPVPAPAVEVAVPAIIADAENEGEPMGQRRRTFITHNLMIYKKTNTFGYRSKLSKRQVWSLKVPGVTWQELLPLAEGYADRLDAGWSVERCKEVFQIERLTMLPLRGGA